MNRDPRFAPVGPRRNKRGNAVWFRHVEGGSYQPITSEGWTTILGGVAAVVFSGLFGMSMLLVTGKPIWVALMFVPALVCLGVVANVVRLHSE